MSTTRCATFDVFDTVLTRSVGSPEAVFLLLGRRLATERQVSCTPESFARARIAAEERAHRNKGADCTLEDICRELARALDGDDKLVKALVQAERNAETDLIQPVPFAAERVAAARGAYGRIVYLSDTYFDSAFLAARLAEHGLWQQGDVCFTSCEWAASKATGELFQVAARELGVRPTELLHTGNDVQADGEAPRRAGWSSAVAGKANPNRYERLLEAGSYATQGLSTALAGASRLARLHVEAKAPRAVAIRDVAAGVVAPVLAGYVLWLLQRARARGLRRLYFLARDGQVLLDLAAPLAGRLGSNVVLRYLYASRQSWNPAATYTGSNTELAWIWDTTDKLTAEMVLKRALVPLETVAGELEAAGLSRARWRSQLTPGDRDALAGVLASDLTRQRMLAMSAQKRSLLLRYFEQEGLLEDTPYGIVDLGWYGSMQRALAGVLSAAGHPAPPGFYFGLFQGDIIDEAPLEREAYYFDERDRTGYVGAVPNLIAFMEMFCTADHGTTVGFDEGGGRIRPVLSVVTNPAAVAWGQPLLRQTIQSFAAQLLLDSTYVNPYADVRDPLTAVLTEFAHRPSVEEAKAWGSFPWEDGLGEDTVRNPFAEAYRPRDLLKALKAGSIRPHHRASWIEGSLALSPAPLAAVLRGVQRLGRRRRGLAARLKARTGRGRAR